MRNRQLHRILWNQKVHYHIHNSPPVVSILRQINPVDILFSYVFKVLFNIILLYTFGSSKCHLSFTFSYSYLVSISPLYHKCHVPLKCFTGCGLIWQTVVDEVKNIQRTKDKKFLVCLKGYWCFEDSSAPLLLAQSYRALSDTQFKDAASMISQ